MEDRAKKQWSLICAGLIGLCILFFIFLKTCISPSMTQSDQVIVPGKGASSYTAQNKSPEPPKDAVDLPKDGGFLSSDQALNRTESGREDQEKLSQEGAVSNSRPSHHQEEMERHEGKLPLGKNKQATLIKKMFKEEIPPKWIGVEQEARREMEFPIGTVISQGNVKMEVKDKVWRMLESPYSPILKGKKIKIGNGGARISLSNNSLTEVGPNSLILFEDEGQLNLLE